jgi:hypothetical protein
MGKIALPQRPLQGSIVRNSTVFSEFLEQSVQILARASRRARVAHLDEAVTAGVMRMPTLVVNGQVRLAGRDHRLYLSPFCYEGWPGPPR